jgi:hypothetical protein
MTAINIELLDALKKAGVDEETARAAAKAVLGIEEREKLATKADLYGRGASHLSPSPVRTHRARLRQWAQDKIIHVPLEKAIANGGPVRRGADATV